eukprot:TRINITY_DN9957_c0_g1_i1.p1 TRINITY_DN9957_c0_g1~~TRINITY_DN9957_c0_g1_i1.p1  ORF type:complete len:460 (+),score=101.78 TRINITY_DN9957_c0_g1_i1:288-1667(+)
MHKKVSKLEAQLEQVGHIETTLVSNVGADLGFDKVVLPDRYTLPENEFIIQECFLVVSHFLRRRRFASFNAQAVRSYVEAKENRDLRKRARVLDEILETEHSYVTSLTEVIEEFIIPLRLKTKLSVLPHIELAFSDLEIIRDLGEIMFSLLEGRLKQWPGVQHFGDIFRDQVPLMKLYARYIRGYEKLTRAVAKMRRCKPKFDQYCVEKAGSMKLEIVSYLVMPVQRLPRYRMLLQTLLDCTSKNHVDYENLILATQEVDNVTNYIQKCQAESTARRHYKRALKCLEKERIVGQRRAGIDQPCLTLQVGQLRTSLPLSQALMVRIQMEKDSLETGSSKENNPIFDENFLILVNPTLAPSLRTHSSDPTREGDRTPAKLKLLVKVIMQMKIHSNIDVGSVEVVLDDMLIPLVLYEKWYPLVLSDKIKAKHPNLSATLHLTFHYHQIPKEEETDFGRESEV